MKTITKTYKLNECVFRFDDYYGKEINFNQLEKVYQFELIVPEMVKSKIESLLTLPKMDVIVVDEIEYYVRSVKLPELNYGVALDQAEALLEVTFEEHR